MKKNIIIGVLAVGIVGTLFYFNNGEQDFLKRENVDMAEDYPQVYETDVDSEKDCASFETYDADKKICSFECKDENECSILNKQAEAEFASWTEELGNDKSPVQEKEIVENADTFKASYKVETEEKIVFQKGSDDTKYREIWDKIKELSPDNLSNKYIEDFEVFSDGKDDTLAFVDDQDQNGKWRVAVNLSGYESSTERENKATIIHELGHIISLNSSQVFPDAATCSNLKLDEGCPKDDSFINTFWNKFWKGVKNPEFDESKFVTEYATTNEVEDLAESFAFFVLGNKPEGNDEKDQKIQLLYTFPDLVAIRTEMRNSLSKDIIRAKKVTN